MGLVRFDKSEASVGIFFYREKIVVEKYNINIDIKVFVLSVLVILCLRGSKKVPLGILFVVITS